MLDFKFHLNRGAFILDAETVTKTSSIGIYGASGSGKSTLLDLFSGLLTPDSGYLKINDKLVFSSEENINIKAEKRNIGYVFQDMQLFPHMNVKDNLLYGYKLTPVDKRKFHLDEIIELLNIPELLERKVHQLSGGQKQRIALGRALLTSPDVILFDEPLASLDTGLKKQILPFLKRVFMDAEIPLIYVSHSIDEILYLTESVLVVDNGKIIGNGKFSEIIRENKIHNIAKDLGIDNTIQCTVISHDRKNSCSLVKFADVELKIPVVTQDEGSDVLITIRPEDIAIGLERIDNFSFQNQLPGKIMKILETDDLTIIEIDIGTIIYAELANSAVRHLGLKKDMDIFVFVKTLGVADFVHCTCETE